MKIYSRNSATGKISVTDTSLIASPLTADEALFSQGFPISSLPFNMQATLRAGGSIPTEEIKPYIEELKSRPTLKIRNP
jgi:hypothetical protein